MTGFDKKVVHFSMGSDCSMWRPTFDIEVDFIGSAGHIGAKGSITPWSLCASVQMENPTYEFHVFPPGYSAHWVRFVLRTTSNPPGNLFYCRNVTAWLTYT